MLRELSVANLALIERLRIEFEPGLNILTGETGAGKSIIIDAVGLALGGRFSGEMVRAEADALQVEAVFELEEPEKFRPALDELGIELGDDHLLILSREAGSSGRNRCRINGQTVTVSTLAKVGTMLMDIHGQHEHQSLLINEKQLAILDAFGGKSLAEAAGQVAEAYERWRWLRQELARLDGDIEDRARRMELLNFQLQEITEAQLTPGEDGELAQERAILAGAEKLYAAAAESYQRLYGGEAGDCVLDQLAAVERALMSAVEIDPKLAPVVELIREAACQAEEAAHEIRRYRDAIPFNPERLEEVERRLDLLTKLKKKYGQTVDEILAYADKIRAELDEVENRDVRRAELERELAEVQERLATAALTLSRLRREAADRLEQAVTAQLAELNMGRTAFTVELSRTETADGLPLADGRWAITASGLDHAEFLVAPNVGEGAKPLAKIASGGELSRIMLAIKAILAEVDAIPTMVFDEIDTGIGGPNRPGGGGETAPDCPVPSGDLCDPPAANRQHGPPPSLHREDYRRRQNQSECTAPGDARAGGRVGADAWRSGSDGDHSPSRPGDAGPGGDRPPAEGGEKAVNAQRIFGRKDLLGYCLALGKGMAPVIFEKLRQEG